MRFEVYVSFCLALAALVPSIDAQDNETEIAQVAPTAINTAIEFGEFSITLLRCFPLNRSTMRPFFLRVNIRA